MVARNESPFIRKAIGSILAQDHKNLELILVDDGSTDQTEEVIYSIDDSRLRHYRNIKPAGLPASLNFAASIAKGRFLARQDADEYSCPSRLRKQIQVLVSRPEVNVVATSHFFMNDSFERVLDIPLPETGTYKNEHFVTAGPFFCHGSTMLRACAFQAVGGYDTDFLKAQDLDLWLRFSASTSKEKFFVIGETLYGRRIDATRLQSRNKQRLFRRAAIYKNQSQHRKMTLVLQKAKALRRKRFSETRLKALEHYLLALHSSKTGNLSKSWGSLFLGLRINPLEPRLLYLILLNIKISIYSKFSS